MTRPALSTLPTLPTLPTIPTIRAGLLLAAALGGAPAALQSPSARAVQVVSPARSDLEREVPVVGTVLPLQSATVMPRVTGYLERVAVEEGDRLAAGELIARVAVPELDAGREVAAAVLQEAEALVLGRRAMVDDARAMVDDRAQALAVAHERVRLREAELAVAQAEVALHEVDVARKRRLFADRAATPEEVEEAEGLLAMSRAGAEAAEAMVGMARAETRAAEARLAATRSGVATAEAQVSAAEAAVATGRAELARVEAMLGFAVLRCPYPEGLVTRRHLDEGALVEAGMSAVATIVDASRVRVLVQVPERETPLVRAGTPVRLRFDGIPGSPVLAEVTRTAGALDTNTRTMRAEVVLDNAEGRFLPGMFCHARMALERRPGALTLPGSAVRAGAEDESYVLVARDGRVGRVDVELGLDDGLVVEIRAGLAGGEQVIDGGVAGLRVGDAVRGIPVDGR